MSEATATCPWCGADVVRRAKTGPVPTYCSRACSQRFAGRKHLDAEIQRRALARSSGSFRCVECDEPLLGREIRLCKRHAQRSSSPDNLARTCSIDECPRPVRARGVCNMHYKATLRREGRIASPPWDDRRRNNYQTRRALKKGASTGVAVLLSQIIERDGRSCSICHEPVDVDLAWPDQMSKSIDHIIPLSRGGIHDPSNCALAHLGCNIAKGAKVA